MKRVAWFAALVLLTLTGLLLLWQFRQVAVMFVLSLALAAAVRPPIDFLVMKGAPRALALIVCYAVGVGILAFLVYFASAPLGRAIQQALDGLATSYESVRTAGPHEGFVRGFLVQRMPPMDEVIGNLAGGQGVALAQGALGVTASLFDIVSRAALVIVVSIYWGIDRVHFERLWLSALPAGHRRRARNMWRAIESGVGGYLRSEIIQSVLAGVVLGLGLHAIGVPYAALLAVIGALVWLVPLVGGAIAVALVLLVGLAQGPVLAIGASLYTAAVLFALEYFVEPRLFRRQRYSSLLVVLTMVALSSALGPFGLLLGPPLAAAIQIAFGEMVGQRTASPQAGALPQVKELRARLGVIRGMMDGDEMEVGLEIVSLIGRLEGLVDAAGELMESETLLRIAVPAGGVGPAPED